MICKLSMRLMKRQPVSVWTVATGAVSLTPPFTVADPRISKPEACFIVLF